MKENSIEEDIEILERFKNNEMQRDKLERDGRCGGWKIGDVYKQLELNNAIEHILSDYKRVLKENEELNKNYNSLIDKIILKIDEYDYKFEKAKKQNKNDIADYYWDLIINFKKLLGGE